MIIDVYLYILKYSNRQSICGVILSVATLEARDCKYVRESVGSPAGAMLVVGSAASYALARVTHEISPSASELYTFS